MKCSLGIPNFLEEISNLSHSVVFLYFFALIIEEGSLKHAVAFKVRQGHTGSGGRGALASDDLAFTCSTNQDQYVSSNGYARYLTPRECERLMGFSDDYTRIPYRGKPAEQCPDSPRYKALGNSIAVPVLAWIGKRINDIMEQEKNQ